MVGIGQFGHAADIGSGLAQRVLGALRLAFDEDHTPVCGRGGGLGFYGLHRIFDIERVQSRFGSAHLNGKSARQFAPAAIHRLANVRT